MPVTSKAEPRLENVEFLKTQLKNETWTMLKRSGRGLRMDPSFPAPAYGTTKLADPIYDHGTIVYALHDCTRKMLENQRAGVVYDGTQEQAATANTPSPWAAWRPMKQLASPTASAVSASTVCPPMSSVLAGSVASPASRLSRSASLPVTPGHERPSALAPTGPFGGSQPPGTPVLVRAPSRGGRSSSSAAWR
eukprot:TRINITY_DN47918_c1_g1_i1.p1 TRINITY_DN47918_c1_g1~~TRINITY_DN47918_c1_g1_i1.p1  ORF type:complete len:193 (+),score=27.32 TRINITY_DN47918_c1_g1_i1:84-662(+)